MRATRRAFLAALTTAPVVAALAKPVFPSSVVPGHILMDAGILPGGVLTEQSLLNCIRQMRLDTDRLARPLFAHPRQIQRYLELMELPRRNP